jgi:3-oxoacyl-[acyl-carrier protein] reductase
VLGPLDGKVALITGAGWNIGRATALRLARDGAAIVANGRSDADALDSLAREIETMGGQALAILADVSDPDAVGRMVAAAEDRFGAVDILVCNAGLRRETAFVDMSLAEWREILSVALDGAFILSKAVVPGMIRRGGGAIVGLSGISTHVGTPNRSHVSAAKAGLEGFMRALAIELAPLRITANCVAPGSVDTVRRASAGARPKNMTETAIPLGRMGTPDDIAAMIRHLVGPEGSYITGQTIHVNGGMFLT